MNNIKEMNGKYYQECEVVMLATDKVSNIGLYKDTKNLVFNDHITDIDRGVYQHLYFLSNEEIKEGDWCLKWSGEKWIICFMDKFNYKLQSELWNEVTYKKFTATTDTSLGLPQPSKEFTQAYVKAYNENKPITKVLVEYKKCYNQPVDENYEKFDDLWVSVELKLNSSNEITIKKIKDSYTRDEVIELFEKFYTEFASYPTIHLLVRDKWIEENL